MKRSVVAIMALLVSFAMVVGCAQNKPQEKATTQPEPAKTQVADGTYQGTGDGKNGPIEVSVDIKGGKIVKVDVVKSGETAGISDAAMAEVPKAIVEFDSVNVNAVTGATLTSAGIMNAVSDALQKAGADLTKYQTKQPKPKPTGKETKLSCDILVVGGGGSGMTAAVRSSQTSKNVILIEKMPILGGATQLNAGTMIATGSKLQRDVLKETHDSPELAYKDIMRVGHDKNDPVLVKAITENAGKIVDWFTEDLKIKYGPAATQYPDHSASRQIGVEGRSVTFIKDMKKIFEANGGKIMLNTRATDLLVKDGAVVGVKATDVNGDPVIIDAKSTILATGGYGAVKKMLPASMKNYLFYGLDSETGDGLLMAEKIGAGTINLDLVKMYPQGVETTPGHALAATASSTATCKKTGAIYVNKDGKRIVNENADLGTLTQVTREQPDSIMYIVMDKTAWAEYVRKSLEDKLVPNEEALMGWAKIVNNGRPVMATDAKLDVAANKMGINAAELDKTVAEYNKMVADGKDTQFGRTDLKPLGDGPYYIVEQKVRYQTTLGGLKADGHLDILDKNGKPIKNLFGAGCVVGGCNGDDSMTAMMNSWANMSGYLAADSAVANLGEAAK